MEKKVPGSREKKKDVEAEECQGLSFADSDYGRVDGDDVDDTERV